eukprot:jgi/Orpsp1_1/1176432/evm.model.c7180000057568.1
MFLKFLKLNIVLSLILFINICYTITVKDVENELGKNGFSVITTAYIGSENTYEYT